MKSWKIDPAHSHVSLLVRHMLVSRVRVSFTRFAGELRFDEAVPTSASVTAHIEAASLETHEPRRDAHLRSRDFLDVERHPLIVFRSTMVHPLGDRQLQLHGELTIRGVTRDVVLDVSYGGRMRDDAGVERVGFAAHATISRKAFGMTFNQLLATVGLAIGDKLEVGIEIEAVG